VRSEDEVSLSGSCALRSLSVRLYNISTRNRQFEPVLQSREEAERARDQTQGFSWMTALKAAHVLAAPQFAALFLCSVHITTALRRFPSTSASPSHHVSLVHLHPLWCTSLTFPLSRSATFSTSLAGTVKSKISHTTSHVSASAQELASAAAKQGNKVRRARVDSLRSLLTQLLVL
jgi:hypothetical protein